MSGLTILLLVLLRVAIGWHFFNEGRDHYFHYERGPVAERWSSEKFMKVAVGPFADQAKSMLPQHHHWDKLLGTPFKVVKAADGKEVDEYDVANEWYNDIKLSDSKIKPAAPKPAEPGPNARNDDTIKKPDASLKPELDPTPKETAKQKKLADGKAPTILDNEHILYVNPIYGAWAKQVRDDWKALVAEAERHYGYNDAQKKEAAIELERHLDLLSGKLNSMEKDLFEYRAELRRYEKMLAERSTKEIPFEKDRLAAKKKELTGEPAAWIAELHGVETWLRAALDQIAAAPIKEQNVKLDEDVKQNKLTAAEAEKQKKPLPQPLPEPVPGYKKVDPYVIWLLMIGGGCMILGLFTRTAAFALGMFLLSVVLLQPFWSADAVKTTYFEWVEVLALFALATTGIGRYAGLDYFIHGLLGGKPAPEIVKTERTVAVKKT